MDKQQFIKLIQSPETSTLGEAEEVLNLVRIYPYSQVLQVLSAKVSQDHGFADSAAILQRAAVYSNDRGQLKAILSATYQQTAAPASTIEEIVKYNFTPSTDWASRVLDDMEKLRQSRLQFELMFLTEHEEIQLSNSQPVEPVPVAVIPEPEPSSIPAPDSEKAIASEKEWESDEAYAGLTPRKARKQRIIDLAKSVSAIPEAEPAPKKRVRATSKTPDILKEIETTKSKLELENIRQIEQIELIDQFMKSQPLIQPAKGDVPANDLSTVKAGEFGEHVVSETLVGILLQQGKKEKAIEVLRKLIWKYPQKKAYFAAQIEGLLK